jgi:hypothetical protein
MRDNNCWALMLLICLLPASALVAPCPAMACDTSVTVNNLYGQNGQLYLFLRDPTNGNKLLISQNFTVPVTNGTATFSLTVDQNGNAINLRPGVLYNLTLMTYGPGVC